ncbi:hypothetical protein ACTMU2_30995 [Cupriavidus basilensis]
MRRSSGDKLEPERPRRSAALGFALFGAVPFGPGACFALARASLAGMGGGPLGPLQQVGHAGRLGKGWPRCRTQQ